MTVKHGSKTILKVPLGLEQTVVTELDKYTEYDLQVLAFTAVGDGPNSSVMSGKTKEDSKKLFTVYFVFIFLKKKRAAENLFKTWSAI